MKRNIKIEFYRQENGRVPVIDFLNNLEKKSKAKAIKSIEILAEGGNALRPPVSKYLTNGIFELRIRFSNDISRILKRGAKMENVKFDDYLQEQLNDPEFEKAYNDLEPEFEVLKTLINARAELNLTQKELAERTGIRQSNLSRIETGVCSPTVETLQKIAKGLDKKLIIRFE